MDPTGFKYQNSPFKSEEDPSVGDSSDQDSEFECDQCHKKFKKRCRILRHIRSIHAGSRTYICPVCGRRISDRTNLKNHIRTHTGERPYACALCNKMFVQKCHLQNHIRTHTGERPFSCGTCSRSFAVKVNLNEHVRIHSNLRSYYKCAVCGKAFMHKNTWRKHIKLHNDIKDGLFACCVCKNRITRVLLNDHTHVEKRLGRFSCSQCKKSFSHIGYLNLHFYKKHD